MPKMTIDDYRQELRELQLPDEVRAAVEVLVAHAERTNPKVMNDHTSYRLLLGQDDQDEPGAQLCLELALI